jgi:hypothetical protein
VEIASAGVPVFVVPGNHERSRIPHDRFASHPNLHLFRAPETKVVVVRGSRVGVSGFPYIRRRIRERFPDVLEETGWRDQRADLRLLCIHHCVEGATVGPRDYTFRNATDVIRCSDLPSDFAAVLSGHIHRPQVLRRDLRGRGLPTPVFYPGSIERTAFAEMGEEKGFMVLDLEPGPSGGRPGRFEFVPLPARPMLVRDLHPVAGPGASWLRAELEGQVTSALDGVPEDAVLRLRVHGRVSADLHPILAAPRLRSLAPTEMNLEVRLVEEAEGLRANPSWSEKAATRTRTA